MYVGVVGPVSGLRELDVVVVVVVKIVSQLPEILDRPRIAQ